MTSATSFADPLGGVTPEQWDDLAAGRLYSAARWTAFCAGDGTNRAGAVTAWTSRGRLAALPVTAVVDEPNPFYRWHQILRAAGLRAPAAEGILAGPHRGYQTHLLGHASRRDLADALLDQLFRTPHHAVEAGLFGGRPVSQVPFVAMFLTTEDVVALRDAGVCTTPVLLKPDAWIPIPPGGWDAWLASLPSRRRAELVRREIRRFDAAGYEVIDTTLGNTYEIAGRLIANTEARYGHHTEPAAHVRSLGKQASAMGCAARVLLCRRAGVPVGYCCYYLFGDTLYLRSAGFDYERLADAAEYFNLVYYLPIRIAAKMNLRWVHAGIESFEAKALRGAQLRPLWMLDLTEFSMLAGHDDDIRRYNARTSACIAATSHAVAKSWLSTVAAVPLEFGLLDRFSREERTDAAHGSVPVR